MTGNQDGVGDVPLDEMISHPDRDLASYADEGLTLEQAAGLTEHLAGCARCARRVDELRAVRRLLAVAPPPRASRSLLPVRSAVPVWLRPARSLAALGAGTFLFLFLASAVLHSGSSLGGGTTAAERAAARGQLSVPAASGASRYDAAKGTTSGTAGAPAASQRPPVVIVTVAPEPRAVPPAEPQEAARREFGPPPWLFAALAALCSTVAFGIHRRLRRS